MVSRSMTLRFLLLLKRPLWIAESQMLEETKDIVFANIDFLPLKSYTNIVEGNALEIDWGDSGS